MESKWLSICICVVALGMFAPLMIDSYTRNQCKLGYAQSDKTAEEIIKICGK